MRRVDTHADGSGMARVLMAVLVMACLASIIAACGRGGAAHRQSLSFLGLTGEIPAQWIPETTTSGMRLAQYRIPGPADAELIVYYFGAGQGGSVEQNAERWSTQFTDEQGGEVSPVIRVVRGSPPVVTLVELHGNYARGVGMGTAAPARPDHTLLAAIVETAAGNAYIQLWGPAAAVAGAREDYLYFLGNLTAGG